MVAGLAVDAVVTARGTRVAENRSGWARVATAAGPLPGGTDMVGLIICVPGVIAAVIFIAVAYSKPGPGQIDPGPRPGER